MVNALDFELVVEVYDLAIPEIGAKNAVAGMPGQKIDFVHSPTGFTGLVDQVVFRVKMF